MGDVKKVSKKWGLKKNWDKFESTWHKIDPLLSSTGIVKKKAKKQEKGTIDALHQEATEVQRKAAAQAAMFQQKGLATIRPAYDAARSRVTVGKGASMDAASDRSAAAGADAQQSLTTRGLYNTTVLDNARVGISGQLSRDMAEIDGAYAQMLGQLDIGEAQALQQGYSAAAGTQLMGASGVANALTGHAQTQAQMQMQAMALEPDPDAWLNSLLGIGGTVLGAYATGGTSLFAGGLGGGLGGGSKGGGFMYGPRR